MIVERLAVLVGHALQLDQVLLGRAVVVVGRVVADARRRPSSGFTNRAIWSMWPSVSSPAISPPVSQRIFLRAR